MAFVAADNPLEPLPGPDPDPSPEPMPPHPSPDPEPTPIMRATHAQIRAFFAVSLHDHDREWVARAIKHVVADTMPRS